MELYLWHQLIANHIVWQLIVTRELMFFVALLFSAAFYPLNSGLDCIGALTSQVSGHPKPDTEVHAAIFN
jgi:hypothetical protein